MACAAATNTMARRGLSETEMLALFKILGRIIDNMKPDGEDGRHTAPAPRGVARGPATPKRAVASPEAARSLKRSHVL
jgi:hypothetical protein